MKILHVHKYYHARDGAGRYMIDLMRLQEGAGHVTAPFAMHDPRNLPSVWDKYFVSALDTSNVASGLGALKQFARAWWSREAGKKMEAVLDDFKPDIVHAHNVYTHLSPSVLAVCRKRGIPVVMTLHDYGLIGADYTMQNGRGEPRPYGAGIMTVAGSRFVKGSYLATLALEGITRTQRALRMFDKSIAKYITLSAFVKEVYSAHGFSAGKMVVIPPAVDEQLLHAKMATERENAVLFASRLEGYKGIETYLQASALQPDVTFYVAGTGPMEREVEAFAKIHKNLMYLGFMDQEALWHKMAHVRAVVVPSLWNEPFGLVAIQSLALGTPIIVSDRGALPEIVKASNAGVIFPAGDEQVLAVQIAAACEGGEASLARTADLGSRGQAYVRAHHAPKEFLESVMKIYADSVC
ncbi:MAG: glycosyltransferase [Patescibacteria group bacterium]|jgi:glycosyltransferase involved in cell wall biosynthesis